MTSMTEQWITGVWPQDKTSVTVRPIQPDDVGLINEMHERLSPDSIYYRYLQYRRPTLDEIAAVCRLDPKKGAGLVATVQQGGESVVGLVYYVREPQAQEPTAEPGILVEDQFQEQGIGRSLWQRMQQHAQANEIQWLHVLFHPTNQRLMRLVQGGGFAYQAKASGGLSEYMVSLNGQPYHAQLSQHTLSTNNGGSAQRQTTLEGQWRSVGDRLYRHWKLVPQTISEAKHE